MTRELDDLILDLRTNELELGTWVFKTAGDSGRVLAYDRLLLENSADWLANEIVHYLKRTLKRLDVTSRSLIALIEPGSCFAGSLLELALAADRSYMLSGVFEEGDPARPATVTLAGMNLGPLPMGNGLTRLQTRFSATTRGWPARAGRPASRWRRRRPSGSAWSRSRPTTSTGTTRSGSRSRNGPASAPTRSPGSRPTTGSPARRPWRRRSSAG